jgi:hypothetical protein
MRISVWSLMVLLCVASSGSAALLVSETFDYDAGGLHGANGGTGFAGSWEALGDLPAGQPTAGSLQEFQVEAGPVAYAGYDALGNAVSTTTHSTSNLTATDLQLASRALSPINTASNSTIWLGFSYEKVKIYSASAPTGLLELLDSNDPSKSLRVSHTRGLSSPVIGPDGLPTGTTTTEVCFRVSLGSSGTKTVPFSWQSSAAAGLNVPFFLLAKVDFTPEATVAYLDFTRSPDALPTSEPIWDAWVALGEDWSLNLDTLRLPAEGNNKHGRIGEIRVGTTLNDVLLVPEPMSLSLLALGALAPLLRKR